MSVKLVTDREICDAVLKVIEDAREEIILMSPYNHNLPELITALEKASRRRNVKVFRYYREGETNPKDHFPNVDSFAVDLLHAKIYANESLAFVTSFNLNYGSWELNREFGLLIQDADLVREIKNYVKGLTRTTTGQKKNSRPRKRSDIPEGAQLTATYKGKHYTCTIEEPGSQPKVQYKRRKGLSLTGAAYEITGDESKRGPVFWWYRDIQISELPYA